MSNLPLFLAVIPFLVFIFLLFSRKVTLLVSSFVTLILYTLIALFFWKIFPSFILISYAKGFLIAIDIFIIIFGAIFFLEILKDLKIISNISYYLGNISKDYRVQVIIIAWFLEAFIEGTAGFGTPAAIAVPILIGLGLTPIRALVIGLIGNSAPGVFGAAGTPIKIGFAGLSTSLVPITAATLNLVGFMIPAFILFAVTRGRENKRHEFLGALPFAIWSGFIFVVSSYFFVSLGQEFPSILGSITGLIIAIISIKIGFLVPKEEISLSDKQEQEGPTISLFKSVLPYIILVSLLILGKIILSKSGIVLSFGVNHTFNLFNPGFIFLISGLITMYIWREKIHLLFASLKKGIKGAFSPFLVVFFMLAMVQVMINTGNNYSGIASAINLITRSFETSLLPLFAPFIGAFGSFMTGSVTVSNIMFGHLFNNAAINLSMSQTLILSLGVVGAAAGNMIALADILTAEAVTGIKNGEVKVLKGAIIPCLIFLFIVGMIGLFISR